MIFIHVFVFTGESQFVCSFVNSTVQQCGLIEYKKTWPSRILPLTCCKDSVDSHLYKYSISRRSIDSESSLLKIRAGLFEEDDDTLTICPKHRYLGYFYSKNKNNFPELEPLSIQIMINFLKL